MRIVRSLHGVLSVLCLGADACGAGPGSSGADTGGAFRGSELPPPIPRPDLTFTTTDGDYVVGHPAQIVAFSPDDPARVVYPFDTRRVDGVHDLPKLLGDTFTADLTFRSGGEARVSALVVAVTVILVARVCYEHERRLEAATPAGRGRDAPPCRRGCARPAVSRAVRP